MRGSFAISDLMLSIWDMIPLLRCLGSARQTWAIAFISRQGAPWLVTIVFECGMLGETVQGSHNWAVA